MNIAVSLTDDSPDGSSLIYTSASVPNSLATLIHSSLGIHSLLKKQTLKHNVIDRDKILVPPNWDSWGKIRVLREGFDVEGISSGWSVDIQLPPPPLVAEDTAEIDGTADGTTSPTNSDPKSPTLEGNVLPIYEETIRDPRRDRMPNPSHSSTSGLEVSCESTQSFLATQLEKMETYKKEEEEAAAKEKSKSTTTSDTFTTPSESTFSHRQMSADVNEHIGPVQFNMGGIQVDADDMLQRLKSRDRSQAQSRAGAVEKIGMSKESYTPTTSTPQKPSNPKADNEALANFFAGLMKKDRTGSPRGERTVS